MMKECDSPLVDFGTANGIISLAIHCSHSPAKPASRTTPSNLCSRQSEKRCLGERRTSMVAAEQASMLRMSSELQNQSYSGERRKDLRGYPKESAFEFGSLLLRCLLQRYWVRLCILLYTEVLKTSPLKGGDASLQCRSLNQLYKHRCIAMAHKDLLLEHYEPLTLLHSQPHKQLILYRNINSSDRAVAKIQPAHVLKDNLTRNVLHEASFLNSMQGYRGIPKLIWSGRTKEDNIVLLVQELGDGLEDRLKLCGGRFTVKTACMVGIEMLEVIKTVHDKGFVHGSLSPKLFQFGKGTRCQNLHINNFRESILFRDPITLGHVQATQAYRPPRSIFEPTAVFENMEKSRRDDIQSIILIVIYLMKGQLPWSDHFKPETQYRSPGQYFLRIFKDIRLICEGVPRAFEQLLRQSRSIGFSEQPAYHWFILKLKSVIFTSGQEYDFVYDWMTSKAYLATLRRNHRIPSLNYRDDSPLMKYLEEKVFPTISLGNKDTSNGMESALQDKYGMMSERHYDPHRDHLNQQADARFLFMLEKRQAQNEHKKVSSQQIGQADVKIEEEAAVSKAGNGKKTEEQEHRQNSVNNPVLIKKKINQQQCIMM